MSDDGMDRDESPDAGDEGEGTPDNRPEYMKKVGRPLAFTKESRILKKKGRGTRMQRLEQLKCWSDVRHMIEDGVAVSEICQFIYYDQKEMQEMKFESLRQYIYKFVGEFCTTVGGRIPVTHFSLLESSKEQIDPLNAMNVLFAIQMDRIMLDYGVEKQQKKTLKHNTGSLKLATDMAKTINEIQTDVLRMRMRAEKEKSVDDTVRQAARIRQEYEEKFGSTATVVALNPESRRKVYNAMIRLKRRDSQPLLELLKMNKEKMQTLENNGVIPAGETEREMSGIDLTGVTAASEG